MSDQVTPDGKPVQAATGQVPGNVVSQDGTRPAAASTPPANQQPIPADVLQKLIDEVPVSGSTAAPANAAQPPAQPAQPTIEERVQAMVAERLRAADRGFAQKFNEIAMLRQELRQTLDAVRSGAARPPAASQGALSELMNETVPAPNAPVNEAQAVELQNIQRSLEATKVQQQRINDQLEWQSIREKFGTEADTLAPEVDRIINTPGMERVPMAVAFLAARGARASGAPPDAGAKAVEEYKRNLGERIAKLRAGQNLGPGRAPTDINPTPTPQPGQRRPGYMDMLDIMQEVAAERGRQT